MEATLLISVLNLGYSLDPVSKNPCVEYDNCYWTEETMLLFPKIDGIACMLEDNAIVATKYGDISDPEHI